VKEQHQTAGLPEEVGLLGFELSEENVAARKRGSLPPGMEEDAGFGYGDICDYLFGRGEKGEYVDYYIAHRIWGDRHVRIWETSETERLETFISSPGEMRETTVGIGRASVRR
jgi:hypothetical protein